MRQHEINRRLFLKKLGVAGAATTVGQQMFLQFVTAVIQGFVNKAYAETNKQNPTYLLSIINNAGMPRWTYDLFFDLDNNPDGSAGTRPHTLLRNWFPSDRFTGAAGIGSATYRSEPIAVTIGGQRRQVWLPALWAADMPTSDGGSVPIHYNLADMMIWRGVNMEFDLQHIVGPHMAVRPFLSKTGKSVDSSSLALPSLGGLVADATDRPVSAVVQNTKKQREEVGSLVSFKSRQGRKPTYSANLYDVMKPFLGQLEAQFDSPYVKKLDGTARKAAIERAVKVSLDEMKTYASRAYPGADILFRNREAAEKLLRDTFNNIQGEWNARVAKYRNLVIRSQEPLRNLIPGNVERTPERLRNEAEGVYAFALAEYLFEKDLCCDVEGFQQDVYYGWGRYAIFKNDEHRYGKREHSAIATNFRHRAQAAQLYEFKNYMKSINKWDDTVVLFSSEYCRRPGGEYGTDHEFYGNVYTVASGRINGPLFLGSLYKGTNMSGYAKDATVGLARDPNKRYPTTKSTVAANLCKILRVDSPVDAPEFLAEDGDGKIVSLAEWPRNL